MEQLLDDLELELCQGGNLLYKTAHSAGQSVAETLIAVHDGFVGYLSSFYPT